VSELPPERNITAYAGERLVAVFDEEDGQEIVRYLLGEQAGTHRSDNAHSAALAAIGVREDLDWESWVEELDRIRHESEPRLP
jgi:hypothetical protein